MSLKRRWVLASAGSLLALSVSACAGHDSSRSAPRVARAAAKNGLGAAAPQASARVDLVARAMPAVVLILNTHADGSVTYGAGTIVDRGLVLTSEHVVARSTSLGAMLYRAGRSTYTPMDGGLSRFLFENQSDVVPAREVSGDATSDLALVQIDTDTTGLPTLPIATEHVKPGDRVFALGHPQETVWSFTAGVVGAIQEGAIQHDAAVSHGSSGGPLLNERGEIVGINIARVVSETSGLAFARPIELATRYLGNVGAASTPLDLSSPESSAVSCWRAQEIGRMEVGDCFDWDAAWTVHQGWVADAIRLAPEATRARLQADITDPKAKDAWMTKGKHDAAGFFVEPHAPSCDREGPLPRELREAKEKIARDEAAILKAHPELVGLRKEKLDPALLKARLRLGIRVGNVAHVRQNLAWVELVGRNPDGSLYRFSELYAKVGERWLQRSIPTQEEEHLLPASYSPPLESYAAVRLHKISSLLCGADDMAEQALPSQESRTPPSCSPEACAHRPGGIL